jgi:predicted permease
MTDVRLTLVIRWSYGYRVLLAPKSSEESSKPFASETSPLIKSSHYDHSQFDIYQDYPISHSVSTSTAEPSFDQLDEGPISGESLTSFPPLSISSTDYHSPRTSIFPRLLGILNPPLCAVLASVIVALISPLQRELFFNKSGFLHNSVFLAIDTAGAVAIPLILVSLGASLVKSQEIIDSPALPIDQKIERKGIFMALFGRMALVPIILFPVLTAIMYWGVS